jgi:hypothetical protein
MVTVHEIDGMFENGVGDVMQQPCHGGLAVAREMPDNQGYANAVVEVCIKKPQIEELGIIDAARRTRLSQTLQGGGVDIIMQKVGKFGGQNREKLGDEGLAIAKI